MTAIERARKLRAEAVCYGGREMFFMVVEKREASEILFAIRVVFRSLS